MCDKKFSLQSTFKTHVESIHEGKNVHCSICKKTLKHSYLTIHLKNVHGNCLQYTCDICENTFKGISNLRLHTERYHSTNKEKNHECRHCGMLFLVKENLMRHLKVVHENSPSHRCVSCGKIFSTKLSLERHILCTHGGQKNYKCILCNSNLFSK